jgi:hypothetical protein
MQLSIYTAVVNKLANIMVWDGDVIVIYIASYKVAFSQQLHNIGMSIYIWKSV